MSGLKVVVPGGLNIDFVAAGVPRLAGKGELVVGRELKIGPGGKSRNIAQMIAALTGPDTVAMIARTVKDPFGLWRIPMDALRAGGVNTDHVAVGEFVGKLPGLALIPVDTAGDNQIYLLPGANADFSEADVRAAAKAFEEAGADAGLLALSLELPLATALAALDLANKTGLRIIIDPGGAEERLDYAAVLERKPFLLKPNEHEAQMLSGIAVIDFESARKAAVVLRQKGAQNVLITAGEKGAYLFAADYEAHIPIMERHPGFGDKDATGCGDQTMATLCAMLVAGKDVVQAAKLGVISGTLQFYKPGIVPITSAELEPYIDSLS